MEQPAGRAVRRSLRPGGAGREGGRPVAGPTGDRVRADAGCSSSEPGRNNRPSLELRPADGGAAVRLGGAGSSWRSTGATRRCGPPTRAAAFDLEARTRVGERAAAADPGLARGRSASPRAARWSTPTPRAGCEPRARARHATARWTACTPWWASWASARTSSTGPRRARSTPSIACGVDLASGEAKPLTAALRDRPVPHRRRAASVLAPRPCVIYGDLPAETPHTTPPPAARASASASTSTRQQRRPRVRMWVSCPGASADRCAGTARLTARAAAGGSWRFRARGGSRRHARGCALRRRAPARAPADHRTTDGTRITRRIVFLR